MGRRLRCSSVTYRSIDLDRLLRTASPARTALPAAILIATPLYQSLT